MSGILKKEFRLLYSSKEQSQNGKRITYLDMVRGIAIFLVVAGHSGLIGPEWNIWLSTFHLPAFFFVSGMLMQVKKEDRQGFVKTLKHKIIGIMVPYFWFSFGSLLVDLLQVLRGSFTFDIMKAHFIQTITLQGYSVLWFLPVLFLAELLMLLLFKIIRIIRVKEKYCSLTAFICCVGFAVAAYYSYCNVVTVHLSGFAVEEIRILMKAVIATGFIAGGHYAGYCFSALEKRNKKKAKKKGLRGFLAKFSIVGILVGFCFAVINLSVVPYIQLMDFNNINIGNPLLYLVLGTTGTLGVLLICRSIPNIPLITFYGQNSLIVMCTHLNFYVLNAGMIIGRDVFVPLPGPDGLQFMISSLICAMILEIPVILIIRICFPFVLGRKHTKLSAVRKKT